MSPLDLLKWLPLLAMVVTVIWTAANVTDRANHCAEYVDQHQAALANHDKRIYVIEVREKLAMARALDADRVPAEAMDASKIETPSSALRAEEEVQP